MEEACGLLLALMNSEQESRADLTPGPIREGLCAHKLCHRNLSRVWCRGSEVSDFMLGSPATAGLCTKRGVGCLVMLLLIRET